mgnify:CR=1 FL=1
MKKNVVWGFIFSIIIVCVNLYGLSTQQAITIIDDEFGYVAMGAQMAGFDWTTLLSTTNYYSFGLGIIFSLLFRIGLRGACFLQVVIILNTMFSKSVISKFVVPLVITSCTGNSNSTVA